MSLRSIIYEPSSSTLQVLNQLLLPHQTVYVPVNNSHGAFACIKHMLVRGAPAIALVAALGLAVEDPFAAPADLAPELASLPGCPAPPATSLTAESTPAEAVHWYSDRLEYLVGSRPTAVNLADAAHKLAGVIQAAERGAGGAADVRAAFVRAAGDMLAADVADNKGIGRAGREWLVRVAGLAPDNKAAVLTHCNTGSLATAGYGTALGIVRALHEAGVLHTAYYTETRPYNQGSRLTGYELLHDGIPATLITDSMAAALFRLRAKAENIVAVVVGADRVAANGDTANKIGTYGLACLARQHGVRFLVAAPRTTIDLRTATGADIVIEERPPPEILSVKGPKVLGYDEAGGATAQRVDLDCVETVSTAALGTRAWNPAFDVTPAELIDGIVTEVGVAEKSGGAFDLAKLFDLPKP